MVLVSIIFLLGLSFGSLAFSTAINGITPTPSSQASVHAMLRHIPKDAEVIYDLGCGFGGLSISAARAFPSAKVIGIENSFFPFIIAYFRQKKGHVKNLKIVRKDFYKTDFNTLAGIIKESYQDIAMHLREDGFRKKPKKVFLAYLCTGAMEKLKPKLKKELKEGGILISNFFKMHGWKQSSCQDCVLDTTKPVRDVFVYTSKSVLDPFNFSHSMISSDS